MEVDGVFEVVDVAETSCRVLDPLDFGIDAFARGISLTVSAISVD